MRPAGWLFALLLVLGRAEAVVGQEAGNSVEEVFRLSNVGKRNAGETRDLLTLLYPLVAEKHNLEVERDRAALREAYRRRQVSIQRVLDESDAHGRLYLCNYGDVQCVVSIAGDPWKEGDLTPALDIREDGSHETTVTTTALGKVASPTERPNPEVVGESRGGTVPFFGLAPDFDDGPGKRPANPAPTKSANSERFEIKEKRSFPKFRAAVSTEAATEGPPFMSPALLVELAKGGETFTVTRPETRRCKECLGFGRVTDTVRGPGSRDPDGKMPCPDCGGAGSREWQVTYVLTW